MARMVIIAKIVNNNQYQAKPTVLRGNHLHRYIGDYPLAMCETRHWLECFSRVRKSAPVVAGYLLQMRKQILKFFHVHRYAISNALNDLVIDDVGKNMRNATGCTQGRNWPTYDGKVLG